ncbi:MAG: hypothetical protein UY79_C0006G0005 [Parcubacteria group bacterium GW2011_GWA2_53_21]|nr:MAG: hypothetical protein UY79_C0006G0005 [Parcubacteria group bacterium GW2011_GWA2_53_21]
MYFKVTVGAVMGVLVIGWLALLKHTIGQGPPPHAATAQQDAARADILARVAQLRDDLKRLPSFRSLIAQLNQQASSTDAVFAGLANKIAGQATSTATSTPQTATSTPRLP